MLTNVYYHNVAGMLDKTDTDGRCYCSSGIGGYGGYWGFGTYSSGMPDHLLGDRKGFGIGSWSRDTGVVIAELAELGLIERANRAGDWNLMISYMAQPPHWSEQGNFPDGRLSFYQGNEERFIAGRRETGNRENDGQGLIILALYHIWIHYGRKTHWVRERYCQIRDNVDFISMQLHDDTPVLNHFRDQKRVKRIPGILYTESECSAYGRSEAEIYSNYICYAALLAGAEFAARAGDDERAAQYRADASCMRTAMAEYFTENDPVYGRVWKLTGSIWPAQSETLAPAFIHQDLYGMNGMDLEGDFREISRNTLKKLIGPEKRYDWANAMGYGQAFITEAAIYLDDRETYTGLVETAAMVCYNPIHKGWEWHIPEGAIISDDGEKWHKLGDLGNAVQQASIMKCIRMLAGIDDTVPEVLQLIPRLPFGWDAIYVTDYPVAIPDGEMTKIVRVDFTYTLTKQGCRMELHAESPIPLVKCRLSHLAHASYCRMNGCDCAYEVACDASGASHIWIKDIKGQQTIVIEAGI